MSSPINTTAKPAVISNVVRPVSNTNKRRPSPATNALGKPDDNKSRDEGIPDDPNKENVDINIPPGTLPRDTATPAANKTTRTKRKVTVQEHPSPEQDDVNKTAGT